MVVGVIMGTINGGLIVFTGVPDIVVTLAMSFVWGGVALLILRPPGGGAPSDYQALGTGTFLSAWIPAGAVIIAIVLLACGCRSAGAAPASRSTRSAPTATGAYLSGVNVSVTRGARLLHRRLLRRDGRPRGRRPRPASAPRTRATSSP
jgi:ribose transport system permease protein